MLMKKFFLNNIQIKINLQKNPYLVEYLKKTKESSEQLDKSDVNQDDENSKEQFIKEFKEISDNNDDNSINDEKIVIVDESVRFVSEEVSNSETVEEKKILKMK